MSNHKIELSFETEKLKLEISENACKGTPINAPLFLGEKLFNRLDNSKASTKLTLITLAVALPLTIYLFKI